MFTKRKAVLISVLLILAFIFTACRSEAAKKADDLINDIGTVSLDSGSAIESAEEAVDHLSDEEKESLKNYTILTEARKTYDDLVDKENVRKVMEAIDSLNLESENDYSQIQAVENMFNQLEERLKTQVKNYDKLEKVKENYRLSIAQPVIDAINQIGEITLNSGDTINVARTLYEDLGSEYKSSVSNYNTLIQAEKSFKEMRAKNVIDIIDSMGEITADSKGIIDAANDAYNQLTPDEQKLVTNYDKIKTANETYLAKLKEKKLAEMAAERAEKQAQDNQKKIDDAKAAIRVTKLWCSEPDSAGGVEVYLNFVNLSTPESVNSLLPCRKIHRFFGFTIIHC